jgi:hypothetical protein
MKKTMIATALLIFLVGCTASPQKKIVGRWIGQGQDKDTALQFFPDGTVVSYDLGQQKDTGKYSFPDATHLLITEGEKNVVFEIQLSGDHLKLMRHQVMFHDVELVKQ